MNFIRENLTDVILVMGILSISIGAFLMSIVTGFYITGIVLILFSVAMYILGGD